MIDLSPLKPFFLGKAVAIFGLARSGLAAAQAFKAANIPVVLWDDDAQRRTQASKQGFVLYDLIENDLSGISALMLSPGVPLTHPAPHPVVLNAKKYQLQIISDIEILSRAIKEKNNIRTVGITGTNGKSTTTALIAHILNQAGLQAIACGNIGEPVLGITTKAGQTILVIEMSSYQIDLCPSFRPDISIFLNITPDHLDRHGTLENYISIKARLLEGQGTGIIGVDDEHTKNLFNRLQEGPRRIIPFSVIRDEQSGLSIQASNLFEHGKAILDLETLSTLKGLHNWQNVMAAYLACRTLGLDKDSIITGLQTYPGLPHRQFLVRTIGNVAYINDSKATNADATEKALKTYRNIYWIVGGKPKEGGLNGLEGLLSHVKKAYVIGEAAEDFANWLEKNNCSYEISGILEVALASAHIDAHNDTVNDQEKGAIVLLSPACASFDQFKSYEHRGDVFISEVMAL